MRADPLTPTLSPKGGEGVEGFPRPQKREREGPIAKRWEGEGSSLPIASQRPAVVPKSMERQAPVSGARLGEEMAKTNSAISAAVAKRALAEDLRIYAEQRALIGFGVALAVGVGLIVDHRRIDIAGTDRIAAHAARRQLERQRLGQQHHSALGGTVDRGALAAHQAGVGSNVDDAAAGFFQRGNRMPAGKERALEVDVDAAVPHRLAHLLRRALDPDARGIDQKVEPAELLQRLAHHACAVIGLAHIDLQRQAAGCDGPGRLIEAR